MKIIIKIVNEIDFLGFGYGFLFDSEGWILSYLEIKFNDKNMCDLFGKSLLLKFEFVEV